jgi:group I intron endonuclease
MKVSGIYRIRSIIKPERVYIGSATLICNRWRVHKYELKRNTHHSNKLQKHYNKYGLEDLIFEIIQVCNIKDLINIEQFYLDNLNPYFNECKSAKTRLGSKASIETKQKMSIAHKGKKQKPISEETRQNMSIAHIGFKKSKETIEKHSLSMIGKNKGGTTWNKGKHQSQKWKDRIGEANKKRWAERKLKNAS